MVLAATYGAEVDNLVDDADLQAMPGQDLAVLAKLRHNRENLPGSGRGDRAANGGRPTSPASSGGHRNASVGASDG
jgi:hypothetical protein